MSQLNEQFRKRLERIFKAWQEAIATALREGQSAGTVRRDLVPEETASFLIALVEGYEVLAKNAQDAKVWNMGIRNIVVAAVFAPARQPQTKLNGGLIDRFNLSIPPVCTHEGKPAACKHGMSVRVTF